MPLGNPMPWLTTPDVRRKSRWSMTLVAVVVGVIARGTSICAAGEQSPDANYTTESLRGRVVWMAEAMQRLHGVKSAPEARQRILALQTSAGELHPLLEDVRGRAFRVDERLRKMDVELLVRRYRHTPLVQVIGVYEIDGQARFEIDYWCSICAIAMYELKACECCQGEIELRRRPVADATHAARP